MGLIALYISKNLGIPVIGTLHTNIQEAIHYLIKTKRLQKKLKEIAWKYLRVYFNRCDKVIVPSEFMVKECRKNGIKNVVFVPNGINLKRFKPLGGGRKEKEKIRKKLKFDILSKNLSKNLSKKIIILFIGRLVREKNLDIVIGSASEIKAESKKTGRDIHFLIVGDGPAKEYYKNLTKKHGVEDIFTFIGRVERENIIDYFKSGDIFVFPSIFETQGIAGIEAMACGLPVAGAKYLAIPDLIKDGYNGYLFAPRNKKECISAVLKTIKERKKLSLGAIKTAKKYSIEKCTNELIDIYKEIIKH